MEANPGPHPPLPVAISEGLGILVTNPEPSVVRSDRIVLQTSQAKKAALSSRLRAEGVSLSEWFQEQLELLVPEVARPSYQEIDSTIQLRNPAHVLMDLRKRDWSFQN